MSNRFFFRLTALVLVLCLCLPVVVVAQEEKFGFLLDFLQEQEAQWPLISPGIDQIPQYYQTDYPNTPYNRGTIASNGCGIVSLAMAATYLKDRVYTPDQLAEAYSYLTGTNVDRYNAMSADLGLPYVKLATKWSHVIAALEKGQLVVLLLNSKSVLTEGQHFVVLTGITGEGRILLNDPYKPNYGDYPVGFSRGFDQKDLAAGFDGAWIYEKQPRDEGFDRMVLEIYANLRGRNAIADLWVSANWPD